MNVNDLADRLEQFYIGTHIDKAAETLRQQAQEIEALKKAIVEYADCVGSIEGKDFIGDLKYMGTSKESIALLYKLNGYDENGYWIHTRKENGE